MKTVKRALSSDIPSAVQQSHKTVRLCIPVLYKINIVKLTRPTISRYLVLRTCTTDRTSTVPCGEDQTKNSDAPGDMTSGRYVEGRRFTYGPPTKKDR